MKAIGFYENKVGDDESILVDVDIPKPKPGDRDILVRIEAVSVDPIDTKVRRGNTGKGGNVVRILGWDASGVVVAVGEQASLFEVGDEVYFAGDITRQGANSEYCVVDERLAALKPKTFTHIEAAAMPLTTITAWESLFDRLNLSVNKEANKGASLLVINGAGGVGSIAIQIAKQVAGLCVVATASRKASKDWCRTMGADEVIDHHNSLIDEAKRIKMPQFDYILCCYATDVYFETMVQLIKPQGSVVALVSTTHNAPLPMNKLQHKSVRFCWEHMFTRSLYHTPDMIRQHELLTWAADLFDKGVLKATYTTDGGMLNAENLRKAHVKLEQHEITGKLVLNGLDDTKQSIKHDQVCNNGNMDTTQQTSDQDLYTKLITLLDENHAHYRLIDHDAEGRTDLVSAMRGHHPSEAAKCIVVMVKIGKKVTRYVLAVVPGDKRVDLGAIKALFGGTYVSFASQEIAERMAGSVSGTVLPFSFNPELELIVDPSVLKINELYFNAARLDRSLALKTSDYQSIASPRIERIAQD